MTVDHILHCWERKENGILMTVRTNNNIAPEDLVELVSCNCNNDCVDGCCTCKTNNVLCTDLMVVVTNVKILMHLLLLRLLMTKMMTMNSFDNQANLQGKKLKNWKNRYRKLKNLRNMILEHGGLNSLFTWFADIS